ncbi:MAG TPA: hypothetical protein VFJ87_11165 [Rhodanobacteraceae bacterium]|jgi:hypothetical protein|nr:hypothetical protein [Rhodanobacteraceae bacterium]
MHKAIRLTALTLAMAAAGAIAGPSRPAVELSPGALLHAQLRAAQMQAHRRPRLPPGYSTSVGDPDSFGRSVRYAGMIASAFIDVEESGGCLPSSDPADQCVIVNPQPQLTSFSFNDMGHITLPGNSTHSLLCFQMTSLNSWMFQNNTASPQEAQIAFNESVTIESALLDDPSLINPVTGQPFNGSLTAPIGLLSEHWGTLQPGADEGDSGWVTRACQAGAISKQALKEDYGLPDSIVNQFFQRPITLRLNASGRAQMVQFAGASFGVRFYGD